MDEKLRSWLILWMTPGIGPVKFEAITKVVSPQELLLYGSSELASVGFKPHQIQFLRSKEHAGLASIEQWIKRCENRYCLALYDARYPNLLRNIPAPPPILFVEGDTRWLSQPQLAIVGSRQASFDGKQVAKQFAAQLASDGVTTTSGMAIGIDGCAHLGALSQASSRPKGAQAGSTIAVLGAGLSQIYPKRHAALAQSIAEHGALVSEFAPWVQPKAGHFPRRNRIISGLSQAVLVVEAAEKSGSLITARCALEQDREVYVVPGAYHSMVSRGSNALINDGATMILDYSQLATSLAALFARDSTFNVARENPLKSHNQYFTQDNAFNRDKRDRLCSNDPDASLPFPLLLANLGVEPTPVDILAQRTHIKVQELMTQLVELELAGHVASVAGGYIRIRGNAP